MLMRRFDGNVFILEEVLPKGGAVWLPHLPKLVCVHVCVCVCVCVCDGGGRGTSSNYHIEIAQGRAALPESLNHGVRQASSLPDFDTKLTQRIRLTGFNGRVAD